jgi:hypothetical protein
MQLMGPGGVQTWSKQFVKEGEALKKLVKELEDSKSAKVKITACRLSIAALDTHLPMLIEKMEDAIKGMGILGTIFDNQVLELGHVKTKLTGTSEAIDTDGGLRGILITVGVEEAATKYKAVSFNTFFVGVLVVN